MIAKSFTGHILQRCRESIVEKGLLDIFIPKTTISQRWKTGKPLLILRLVQSV